MRRPRGTGEEQRVVSVRSGRKKVGQREKSMKMRSVMVVSGGGGGRERAVLVVDEKKRKVRRGKLIDGGGGEGVAAIIIKEFKARTGVEDMVHHDGVCLSVTFRLASELRLRSERSCTVGPSSFQRPSSASKRVSPQSHSYWINLYLISSLIPFPSFL